MVTGARGSWLAGFLKALGPKWAASFVVAAVAFAVLLFQNSQTQQVNDAQTALLAGQQEYWTDFESITMSLLAEARLSRDSLAHRVEILEKRERRLAYRLRVVARRDTSDSVVVRMPYNKGIGRHREARGRGVTEVVGGALRGLLGLFGIGKSHG